VHPHESSRRTYKPEEERYFSVAGVQALLAERDRAIEGRENANAVSSRLEGQIRAARLLVSGAQGMCSDELPHHEINAQLDKVQRALDGAGGSTA
jgi:hypothetical protein